MDTPPNQQYRDPGPIRKKYVRTGQNEDVSAYMKKRALRCREQNENYVDLEDEQVSSIKYTLFY